MKASDLIRGLKCLIEDTGKDPEVEIRTKLGDTTQIAPAAGIDLYGPEDGYPDWCFMVSNAEAD